MNSISFPNLSYSQVMWTNIPQPEHCFTTLKSADEDLYQHTLINSQEHFNCTHYRVFNQRFIVILHEADSVIHLQGTRIPNVSTNTNTVNLHLDDHLAQMDWLLTAIVNYKPNNESTDVAHKSTTPDPVTRGLTYTPEQDCLR